MKIKKFTARTFSEALELVRKELSPDAIILSTEEKKGFRPHVEVTAAEDYEAESAAVVRGQAEGVRGQTPRSSPPTRTQQPAFARQASYGVTQADRPETDELRSEINSIRTMLESLKSSGYEMSLPAGKRAVLKYLLDRSVREEFALRICDKTTDVKDIPRLIASDIKVKPQTGSRKAVMFIGPTGVGKTTTIAKLAAQAVKAGKKAALINLDTWRIGAVEQVRIYSRILGIPLATAGSAAEFRSCLKKFAETRDVVFIDTAGKNPRDAAYLADMAELCGGDIPIEVHLLMSANADDACMIEACEAYRTLPVDYIGFSKLDEAVRFGPLYNLCLTYAKPVSWLTTGQRVPGDIEPATPAGLAELIVGRERPVC